VEIDLVGHEGGNASCEHCFTLTVTDCEPGTWLLDTSLVASSVTSYTKASMPVHLNGQMVDMEEVESLARRFGVSIVEDAAQVQGASQRIEQRDLSERSLAPVFILEKILAPWEMLGQC
jgi:hypothetical protein